MHACAPALPALRRWARSCVPRGGRAAYPPSCGATRRRSPRRSDDRLASWPPARHFVTRHIQAHEGVMGASALIGIVALLIILWFMHKYVQANPRGMAWVLQRAGGIAVLVAATFLAVRGEFVAALPLALMGFGLLGWMPQLSLGNSDRRGAGRGENAQNGANARQRAAPGAGKMTKEEAY